MQRISRTKLGTLGLPKPPLSTQDKIVSYLNEVIKKIDICIENKLRLSELLQESRTSIICSAISVFRHKNCALLILISYDVEVIMLEIDLFMAESISKKPETLPVSLIRSAVYGEHICP